jgi:hypothetical protein
MPLFDGFVDPQKFGEGGGLLVRLRALQPQLGQDQAGAGFDLPPFASQSQPLQPMPWPGLADTGQALSDAQPATSNLTSQYQALLPVLGDHDATLATVSPEAGKALLAQALANQQPDNSGNVVQAGYRLGGIPLPFPPTAPVPLPPIPMPEMPDWMKAAGAILQLYGRIRYGRTGSSAAPLDGSVVLNNDTASRPPAGSRPIDQTDWSGDHTEIKQAVGAQGNDDVRISPSGEVWAQKPDGSWENHGPADTFTGSGKPSGRRGKDRDR